MSEELTIMVPASCSADMAWIEKAHGKDVSVKTPAGAELATRYVRKCREVKQELHQARVSFTKPLDEQKKKLVELERTMLAKVVDVETAMRSALTAYTTEQERLKAESEKRAREAAAAAAMEAAAKGAEPEEIAEAAQQACSREVFRPASPPRGVKSRKVPAWEIVDVSQVPAQFLKKDPIDGPSVRAHMRDCAKMGTDPEIPGLRCFWDTAATVR